MRRTPMLLLMAALLAGPAVADPPAATPVVYYTPTDLYGYLAMAGACDQFAVQSSRLALVRTRSDAVKAYARAMIASHAGSAQTLIDESHRAGLHPPDAVLTGDLQRRFDALARAPEAEFDGAYMAAQIEVQQQELATHRVYAASGDNAILRAVAASLEPMISERLAQAQALIATPDVRPPTG